jgi:hypothetical protein
MMFLASINMSLNAFLTFFNSFSSYSANLFDFDMSSQPTSPLKIIVQPNAGLHPSKYIKFLSFEDLASESLGTNDNLLYF